jgi:hypothetical protein
MLLQKVSGNFPTAIIITAPAFDNTGKRLHGRFAAILEGRQLCVSREPLLAASRILLAEGMDPATPIIKRHAGSDFDAMRSTIGEAAKWTVRENETEGPYFVPYRAFPRDAVHPPMRFEERPVSEAIKTPKPLSGATAS